MKIFKLALLGALLNLSTTDARESKGPEVTYSDEEEMKPPSSDLKHQSPINIRKRRVERVRGDAGFDYKYGKLEYSDSVPVGHEGVMFKFKEEE